MKSINITKCDVDILLRALDMLIEAEEDTGDYSDLINKLKGVYDD